MPFVDKSLELVEGVPTMLLCYISAQFGITVIGYGIQQVAAYVGIFNTVLLSVFIYATATASGGHINPTITWTTFWCGLCPAPRGTRSLPRPASIRMADQAQLFCTSCSRFLEEPLPGVYCADPGDTIGQNRKPQVFFFFFFRPPFPPANQG